MSPIFLFIISEIAQFNNKIMMRDNFMGNGNSGPYQNTILKKKGAAAVVKKDDPFLAQPPLTNKVKRS